MRQIARRYREGGLERALYEGPRPGKGRLLDQSQRQKIVAMVCGRPPAGQARWTVRLIVEQAQRKKLVPRVGRETIRMLLQDHDLKPWREKKAYPRFSEGGQVRRPEPEGDRLFSVRRDSGIVPYSQDTDGGTE